MKVVFLSQRFLFPQDTGGKIRTSKILEQLNKIFSLTVLSNMESPQDDPYLPEMERICDKFIPVPWVETKRYTLQWYLEVLKKSFSRYPVPMLNDYSAELERAVLDELNRQSYDLAICDFMQSTLNFQHVKNIPRLLFQHNVEATIAQRHMQRAKDPFFKIFWWLQFKKMFYHEKKQCGLFDRVIAVSENDKLRMEDWYGVNNVCTIPTGVDTEFYAATKNSKEKKQIVFVGAMDWLPNDDAMKYFLNSIFPLIQKQEPGAHFIIVGRNPSPALKKTINKIPNVKLTGWVEDTRPYIAESAVFIVPIRIGGGTRMKIYEGMAMGKAIVSTSIGAEGLPVKHGEHIYLADTETRFAEYVIKLLQNTENRQRMGMGARQYVYNNFRWKKVAEAFANICQETVKRNNTNALKSAESLMTSH
ncbi:MAG: glycosyltransferase [Nitrosopumilaceae archaeon]|nr:glycosyltransferase [Nitrosopumilaceae archaeon]NIU88469.1 glycosyltransferase [Nitrosopumilaceae archaeon]NIV66722.1 glycosyltransferase [Nitrosopumilaceae archaeon]NIX62674.1 glycosyltransferase [Nitrosopumilaceae archaeon]